MGKGRVFRILTILFCFLTILMSVKEIWVLHILSVLVLICAVSVFDWKNAALQATASILAYNSKLFSLGIGSDLTQPLSACLFILSYIYHCPVMLCYVYCSFW